MKAITILLTLACCSSAAAQFPIGRPEAVSSTYYGSPTGLEYRRQMAEQRRQARREAERKTWARMGALPPADPEKRAAGLMRMANTFATMKRWDLRDKWLAKVADELP